MAVVKRRTTPQVKKVQEVKEVKAVKEEAVVEDVAVVEQPKKETKVSKNQKPAVKKEAPKATTKKEAVVEDVAVVEQPKKETKVSKNQKPAVKKEAPKATTKKEAKAKEEPKKETKVRVIGKNPKAQVNRKVEIAEAGTLKRDDLIFLFKERLKEEHGLELATLEDSSRIIKTFEGIIKEALESSNIVHLCGRNFNRKKVKARVFNPPIGDGAAYLVLPHYKMAYSLELSEKLKGQLDEDRNFVAEDGTVYTPEMIAELDKEYFGEE